MILYYCQHYPVRYFSDLLHRLSRRTVWHYLLRCVSWCVTFRSVICTHTDLHCTHCYSIYNGRLVQWSMSYAVRWDNGHHSEIQRYSQAPVQRVLSAGVGSAQDRSACALLQIDDTSKSNMKQLVKIIVQRRCTNRLESVIAHHVPRPINPRRAAPFRSCAISVVNRFFTCACDSGEISSPSPSRKCKQWGKHDHGHCSEQTGSGTQKYSKTRRRSLQTRYARKSGDSLLAKKINVPDVHKQRTVEAFMNNGQD